MNIAAKKIELMDWLLHINDESKLKKVLAFKTILDAEIVAYDVKGNPISKDEYINMVHKADKRISSGEYKSIDDLEKEIENW
ncbi:hypothetical protein [Flavobacterium sp.]|uniref:hypothetical protein n=1 Tax=Flavobacterium sp. TaxID=239 RepID=UPI00286E219A|nr:hypothetical protein [Flavobacterium sp.]